MAEPGADERKEVPNPRLAGKSTSAPSTIKGRAGSTAETTAAASMAKSTAAAAASW